jgi:hypothetical protein
MNRTVLAIVLSVVVVAAALTVVLVFGVIPLPDYPSLVENPDPSIPGTIAFVSEEEPACLGVVAASGGPVRELRCGSVEVGMLAWTSDGLIVTLDFTAASPRFLLVDPVSGGVVDTVPAGVGDPGSLVIETETTRADGAEVFTDDTKGTATVKVRVPNQETQVVLAAEGPHDYRFDVATWSPDGRWVLVVDSEGRLLIVGATGEPTARVLVTGASRWMTAAWYIPGYPGLDPKG